jgi:aerobic-type carbon monoxide dehydrogenase small subunit (CoxS/CutS family)
MPDAATIKLNVNGREVDVSAVGDRSLLEILREDLALTGTKYGCGEGACGACSVLVDGKRIFSCSTPVSRVAGKSITTIEGLATGDALHPVQQAFLDERGFQCGYCTPGMVVAAIALLGRKPNPTDDEICDGLNGNLCRCCGYENIKNAVRRAAGGIAKS